MQFPNRNYLAAQNKNLVQAGDMLAALAKAYLKDIPGGSADLEAAIRDWHKAQKNLMGLAGRR